MTVQQERPDAAAKPAQPTTAPDLRVPEPRSAGHDATAAVPAAQPVPVRRQPGAWGSEEDRKMVRWLGIMMVVLSLYCTAFLWIAARVWT